MLKNPTMSTNQTPNRLLAVDLRSLPEEKMTALRQEAIRRGISIDELLADLIDRASKRLLDRHQPKEAA